MAKSRYDVSYCRRWNFRRHRPIDPLTAKEAIARDSKPETYSVILHDPFSGNVPAAVIEIAWENDFAGVWFFDAVGRQSLNYAYRRTGDTLSRTDSNSPGASYALTIHRHSQVATSTTTDAVVDHAGQGSR